MQSRDENRERESKINVVIHPKRHTRPQQEERRKKENGGKQRLRRISSRQQAGKQLKKERASGAWHPTRTRARAKRSNTTKTHWDCAATTEQGTRERERESNTTAIERVPVSCRAVLCCHNTCLSNPTRVVIQHRVCERDERERRRG